jgi:hypothetical protein
MILSAAATSHLSHGYWRSSRQISMQAFCFTQYRVIQVNSSSLARKKLLFFPQQSELGLESLELPQIPFMPSSNQALIDDR